jgi:hypothetical protein
LDRNNAVRPGEKNRLQPAAALVMDAAGSLYGTAAYCGARRFGTVFKITP